MAEQADFIEGVAAGIGGAFGGMKELKPVLRQMRNGGVIHGKE